jgi:4a-hydroxytetrahydrobiopterin dehydratase
VELLDDREIQDSLSALEGWERDGDHITREYDLEDFVEAVELVDAFVEPAEDLHHHPDLSVSWGSVGVRVTTHDAGGLTELDFQLAEKYNRIYREEFQ